MLFNEKCILCLCDFETTGLNANNHLPIEIGFYLLDYKFNKLAEYTSLIKWPEYELLENQEIKRSHILAQQVHKIDYKTLMTEGKNPSLVVSDMITKFNKFKPKFGKIILTSDNIRFEWEFMKVLLGDLPITDVFHYAGWDTSMFLEATKIGDPTTGVKHRALDDVAILYKHIVEAKKIVDLGLIASKPSLTNHINTANDGRNK